MPAGAEHPGGHDADVVWRHGIPEPQAMRGYRLYAALPVGAQNLACSIYGYRERNRRLGGVFRDKLASLQQTEWWSEAEIEAYQDDRIEQLIRHAYNTVPYYRELFTQYGLRPDDVTSRNDLQKLPPLTKEIVRAERHNLRSSAYPMTRLIHAHTSGSTGTSLDFYTTKEAIQCQWAVWWRFRLRFGVSLGEPHCNFTGKPVAPPTSRKPPYWRYNRAINQYLINMQHITPDKIAPIATFLSETPLAFYTGYPSIVYQLCVLLKSENLTVSVPPRFVFTGAERLDENQRAVIEEVLGCQVTDQYGMSEMCANASRCEHGRFHEDFEFGVIRCQSDPRLMPQQGKVLGTGFANLGMPLINYDVGDIVTTDSDVCPCGRRSRTFSDFAGRSEDFVITPENRKILRFDYIFKDSSQIREAQVVQREPGRIVIRVVRRFDYSAEVERLLRTEVKNWISPTLGVDFEYVDEIERTITGKFRAVVSMLGPE